MSVLINKETGLAEALDPKKATEALSSASHEVPVINPEGHVFSTTEENASKLLEQGYTLPKREHIEKLLHKAKYGSKSQQALTAAEGAASSATLGLSTGVETALGVDPADIASREATNPKSHLAGSVAGVLIPGAGIESLGAKGAKALIGSTRGALGLGRDVMAAKQAATLGARAINNGIQGAIMQGGDEVHKMFLNDPNQTFATALSNIGLSGMLTGGLGTAVPAAGQLVGKTAKDLRVAEKLGAAKEALQKVAANNPELISAAASFAMGHGAIPGAIMGNVARAVGLAGKLSSAARWVTGKLASTEGEMEAGAVKSLWKYTKAVFKGNKEINQGIESMFNEGASQMAPKMDNKQVEKLNKLLDAVGQDPTKMQTCDLAASYADHAAAGTAYMARAVNYLNELRPKEEKLAPMSPPLPPNAVQEGRYRRALQISDQPLAIIPHIKNGSLTPEDMHTMEAVHPDLLQVLRSRTFNAMAEHAASGGRLPYKSTIGLSLFLGQPLVSSLMAPSIVSNQAVQAGPPQQQQPQQGPVKSKTGAFKTLSKEAATPGQARELNRQSRVK